VELASTRHDSTSSIELSSVNHLASALANRRTGLAAATIACMWRVAGLARSIRRERSRARTPRNWWLSAFVPVAGIITLNLEEVRSLLPLSRVDDA
jgi:hypothetical protein